MLQSWRLRSVRRILVLMLALLWVPLTAHCRIASVPGLEFLRCSSDQDHHDGKGKSSDEDCGCCVQEHGKYSSSRWEKHIPEFQADLIADSALPDAWCELAREESEGVLTAAPPPPPLDSCWVFTLRLALPVRAPSAVV